MKTHRPESNFQVGDYQLKAIRELPNTFDAEIRIINRDAMPTPPDSLMNNITKLPRVEYQTYPPPRVDPYGEYNNREYKLPSPIQTTPPSAATMEKHTKKLKALVKQRRRGHYTGKKMTYREQHTGAIPERKEQEWIQWSNMLQY